MFCHRGIGANVDVVGAVLGCFRGLLEPSWGPLGVILGALGGFLGARWAFWGSCWVLLGSPCRPLGCSLNLLALSQAGQRVHRTTVDGVNGQRVNGIIRLHQRGAPRSLASLGLSSVPERVRAKRLQKFVLVSRDAECCYRCSRKQTSISSNLPLQKNLLEKPLL